MELKNKDIGIKASLFIILIVVVLQNLLNFYFDYRKTALYKEIESLNSNINFLRSRFIYQMNWSKELLESIIDNKKFAGQLNHNETEFGSWYYSFIGTEAYYQLDEKRKKIFDQISEYNIALHNSARKITGAESTENAVEIYKSETKFYLKKLQNLFKSYINENIIIADLKRDEIKRSITISHYILVVSTIFLVFMVLFLLKKILNRIMNSHKVLIENFNKLFDGHLDLEVDEKRNDEYGILFRNFNEFIQKLREVILKVKDHSGILHGAAESITISVENFSGNVQVQAVASEEITSSVEEILAGMDSVSQGTIDHSNSIKSLMEIINKLSFMISEMDNQVATTIDISKGINKEAKNGEYLLQEMNEKIEKIDLSSKEVIGIIEIINNISDQINLLSLNASIEAARAGEFGKGFAVVAGQISKLADETSSSIKKIEKLIHDNKEYIATGAQKVKDTVSSINKIISGVTSIDSKMEEIGRSMKEESETSKMVNQMALVVQKRDDEIRIAVEEQKGAVNEISKSLTSISELSQDNALKSSSISDNVRHIETISGEMAEKIGFFKVVQ